MIPRPSLCGAFSPSFCPEVQPTLLVNVGAVGFPFDGDRRASFGLITWDRDRWEVEIRRIEYAVEKVLEEFERVNFYQGAGPLST